MTVSEIIDAIKCSHCIYTAAPTDAKDIQTIADLQRNIALHESMQAEANRQTCRPEEWIYNDVVTYIERLLSQDVHCGMRLREDLGFDDG